MHKQEQNCSDVIYTFFPWGNNSLLEYLSVLHQVHPWLLPSTLIYTMKAIRPGGGGREKKGGNRDFILLE